MAGPRRPTIPRLDPLHDAQARTQRPTLPQKKDRRAKVAESQTRLQSTTKTKQSNQKDEKFNNNRSVYTATNHFKNYCHFYAVRASSAPRHDSQSKTLNTKYQITTIIVTNYVITHESLTKNYEKTVRHHHTQKD